MKQFSGLVTGAKRFLSVASTQIDRYTPELCLYGGGALIVGGAICAFCAGKKIEKEKKSADLKKKYEEIDNNYKGTGSLSKRIRGKEKRRATVDYIIDISSTVLPPIAMVGGGLMLEYLGYKHMKDAEKVLTASLASAVAANKALRGNVENTYGKEAVDVTETNGHYEVVEKKELDEKGNEITVKDHVLVIDEDDIFSESLGPSFIYSYETAGKYFVDNQTEFLQRVHHAEEWGARKLQDIDGYLFNEKIVDIFGVDPRPIDHTVGWVYDAHNEALAGKVVLDYKDIYIRHSDGSMGRGWLIRPNIDGTIIDIYPNYSLHMLYRRKK